MRKISVLFLVMLCSFTLSIANEQSIIPLTDQLYGDVDSLYIAVGEAIPSTSRPWSYEEAQRITEKIDHLIDTPQLRTFYERLRQRVFETDLRFSSFEDYQFDIGLTAAGELYGHTNSMDFDTESDWLYGYDQRSSLLKVHIDLALHDWFYTYCDLEYQKSLFAEPDKGRTDFDLDDEELPITASYLYRDPLSTNLFDMQFVDFETPYRAFVSFGSEGWNLQLGRDRFSWGPGEVGNFVISDNLSYQDAIRFVSYHDYFKYEFFYSFFDQKFWGSEDDSSYSAGEQASTGMEMFIGHRLEFRILDTLSLALSENVMYAHDFIDLRYLNPAYILHNLNNRDMFNAIAYAELNAAIHPGFNIYGQFALDQARAPLEDSSQPGAFAYMLGLKHALPTDTGMVSTVFEAAYTDPYLYQRDGVDFKVAQRHFMILASPSGYPGGYIFPDVRFLGYQYGGDAVTALLKSTYRVPGTGMFSLALFGMLHGQIGLDTHIDGPGDYPNAGQLAPSGDVILQYLSLSTSGMLEFPSMTWLSAWYELDLVARREHTRSSDTYSDREVDLQCSLGFSLSL